ncbi:epoxyqueuosine reductase QueH [Candidatus Dojkabacteria bacterium]|nr:epoxyqueuosine reductase QueH [Candidatus Dojkabacteria bacterium]
MKIQEKNLKANPSKSLLLHTCCADCALKFIHAYRELVEENSSRDSGIELPKKIILYFDNSNIHPRTEYLARLEAVMKISDSEGLGLVVSDWSPKKWFKAIKYNSDNKNLRRCRLCWEFRLKRAYDYCKEENFGFFSTTLLSSHYQCFNDICEIGKRLGSKGFVTIDPRKAEVQTKGFYKQNYCGCVYSLVKRYEGKFGTGNT